MPRNIGSSPEILYIIEERAMTLKLPRLEILPVDKILPHEHFDEQRTGPLMERLKASGVLRNPPIVAPFQDGTGRYMVLDGANRTTAIRKLGYPHILAQVVPPDDPGLDLKTWNHVVWGLPPEDFFARLQAVLSLPLEKVPFAEGLAALRANRTLVLVSLPDGTTYATPEAPPTVEERVEALNRLVEAYIHDASVDRTSEREVMALVPFYEGLSGLVIFPHFEVHEVMTLAGKGLLFPAGITRFTIAPRALRVNYPLAELAAPKSLEEKNRALQQWIQERIARKGVRYYAEPTVLFDE